jgi:hypothetical protein
MNGKTSVVRRIGLVTIWWQRRTADFKMYDSQVNYIMNGVADSTFHTANTALYNSFI